MKKKSLLVLLITLVMCFTMASAQAEAEFTAPSFYSVVTVEGPDPQEMLDGFALREMYGMRGVATWGVTARRTLSEPMKLLYDALKEEIEKVAIGSRSSTVFTFSAEEMKEMGFNTIFEYTDGAGFYAQVDIFLAQVSDVEIGKLLNALLLDCPYDMYWYDQTSGMSTGSGDIHGSSHVGRVEGLTFTMPVSAVFRGENANTVAAKWGSTAVAAGEKAAAIIEAAKDMPDHEKLNYYAEQIMALVDYNDDAAAGMDSYYASVDANPWQLIYVFDGDPSTNVVCEGYSKAFQYLCDETLFENDDIRCITVTGQLAGGTGAGGHMWNVVRMEDGQNYIMDVTNSEQGTAGEDGELMLGGSGEKLAASGQFDFGYLFDTVPETSFRYAKTVPYEEEDLLLADSKYEPKYSVTFYANNGTGSSDEQQVKQGEALTLGANGFTPPANGFFMGWNTKADGTGVAYADGASITPTGNMTLFAQWKIAAVTLTSGGVVSPYDSIKAAYDAAKDGDIITLLQDITLGDKLNFMDSKTVTLTGAKLTYTGTNNAIVTYGGLILEDITVVAQSEQPAIMVRSSGNKVTIRENASISNKAEAVYVMQGGLLMDGGSLVSQTAPALSVGYIAETVEIKSGTLTSSDSAALDAAGKVTLGGEVVLSGNFDGQKTDIFLNSNALITFAEKPASPLHIGLESNDFYYGVFAVPGENVDLSPDDFLVRDNFNRVFVKEDDGSIALYYDLSKAEGDVDWYNIYDPYNFFTYTGNPIEPPLDVTHCPNTDKNYVTGLGEGYGYFLTFENNINAGDEAKAILTGNTENGYYGTKEILFSIFPAAVTDAGGFDGVPEAGKALPTYTTNEQFAVTVDWSPAPVNDADGNPVADFATVYNAKITFKPNANYAFSNVWPEMDGFVRTEWLDDGSFVMEGAFPATRNRCLNSLAKPEDEYVSEGYCATVTQAIAMLPATLPGDAETIVGDLEDVILPITWSTESFNASAEGETVFTWTVDADALAGYNVLEDVVTSGTVTFVNGEGQRPTIRIHPIYREYAGEEIPVVIDVADAFEVVGSTGARTYSLSQENDFVTLEGSKLTFTRPQSVTVIMHIAPAGQYSEATEQVSITLEPGTPDVEAPTGMTGPYGFTLEDVAFSDPAWSWVSGADHELDFLGEERTFEALYTPADTTWWNPASVEVGVTPVRTALTVSGEGTASGIYGDSLSSLSIEGLSVSNFKGENVNGQWTFTEEVESLAVGTHTYQAAFASSDLYLQPETQDVTVTVGPMEITGIIEMDKDEYPYTGQPIVPQIKVYHGDVLIPASEYVVTCTENVELGLATLELTDAEGGNYIVSGIMGFFIVEAETDLTGITVDLPECTYGDVVTISAKPEIKVMAAGGVPRANQMALYDAYGRLLCDAVDPDEDGVYTMSIDTTEKGLAIGENQVKLRYVSDGKKGDAYGYVTITVNPRDLTLVSAVAENRVYEPGNQDVDVTEVILDGIVALDNVFVVMDEYITGTLESDQAGVYTSVALPELELDGTDLEWYNFIASETVTTDVEIYPLDLLDVVVPKNQTLTDYAADADSAAAFLPKQIVYLDENGVEWPFDLAWECDSFDARPSKMNNFTWTLDDADLVNFHVFDDLPTSGSIRVTNADGLPVEITSQNKTFTYNGSNASVDVTTLFTIGENAGEASYSLAETDCATLTGTTLTFTKAGVVSVMVHTAAHDEYLSAVSFATVKMNKGTMTPVAPAGMTGVVGQTLADVAFTESGWAWADDTAALTTAGERTFPAIFTPADTGLWEQASGAVSLTVKPSDLTVSGTGAAQGIYTMKLEDMPITGLTVKDSSGNEVPGVWAFVQGTAVPDAGETTWQATFTPDVAANYNAAAAQDVTVTVQAKTVTATVKLEYDTHAYTGSVLEPTVAAYDGETLIPADEYTVEYTENLNVGTATVTLTDAEGGNYTLTGSATFTVTLGETELSNLKADKAAYTYGEVITVTAQPTVKVGAVMALRIEPKANQMALYLGELQVSDAVDADLTGSYTMTVNTADKALLIGENKLTARYVSDGNKADAFGDVTITLNRANLTATSATATSRDYASGNKQVEVTAVTISGVLAGDEVSVGGLPAMGLLSSDAAGDYTTVTLPADLALGGDDADWYSLESRDAATQVTISKKPLSSVTVPVDQTMDVYFANPEDAAEKLPQTVTYEDEDGNEVEAPIKWTCDDFDKTPGAENTFHWTIDPEVLNNHEPAEGVDTEGDITVTNPSALPVTVEGKDATITYDGSAYDVSALFTVDENAGAKTYQVVSGDATLTGTSLTILKAGQIKISLSTAANDPYAAAEATAALTVRKGDPLVSAPIGLTATYGQTLADVALPAAQNGAWSWVDSTASVGEAGVNQHKLLFTPNDTDNWNTLTLDANVTVSKAAVGFDASVKVYHGEEETSTFIYGEVATVKAQVKPVSGGVTAARLAPGQNQMALYLGDEQVSDAADPVDGVYTLTVDTKAKELPVGTNKLKLKYVGTENLTDAEAEVSITVKAKTLNATAATATDRAYIPGNKLVAVTAVTLEGALSGDDVSVSLSGLKGAVASDEAGVYEEVALSGLTLTGADAAYYTLADATVPTHVEITKALPETNSGLQPEPEATKPYKPGITLEEAEPELPEGTFDVPGKLIWDVPADTVIEPGKSYPWTFQPEDSDNYQPVKGESVIYPLGDKPEVVGPDQNKETDVQEGAAATFSVNATDADNYQWQVDRGLGDGFEDIEGANGPSYTTDPLTPAEDGYRFRCVVMNDYGTAVSPEFIINVTEKPTIPVTGDKTNLILLFSLALMSLAAMSFVAFRRKEN